MKTKVIFMKHRESGEVYAVFPDQKDHKGMLGCYAHIGQHGSCSQGYIDESDHATPIEFLPLKKELEELVGYDLQVLKPRNI